MIGLGHYKDQTMAVFGLARSGLASAHALAAAGAQVVAWDDSPDARDAAGAEGVSLSDIYAADWPSIGGLVLSPGIPLHYPKPHALVGAARAAGCPVIGDVELFAKALEDMPGCSVVAVTGTNGKSTTAALIGHLLLSCGRSCVVAGNIGRPVLALDALDDGGIYVLEMSSYQIDLTHSLAPDIAVLLNIAPDHLDRHGGMTGYIAAKRRLFEGQDITHTAIVGIDDDDAAAICRDLSAAGKQNVMAISAGGAAEDGVWVADGMLYEGFSGAVVPVGDISALQAIPGRHNCQNIAAAYAVARVLGLEAREIFDALKTFSGLAHRLETVAQIDGVRFVNDSKATNAAAAARALETFENIHWIVGGRPKAGGIEGLGPMFEQVRRAYLIGEASEAFAATLGANLDHVRCGTLDEAVRQASADAFRDQSKDAVVLLSPACASFDQFDDFEARGDAFRALSQVLAATGLEEGAA